ncbi:hypothetical protein OAJ97_05060 [Candidatus Nitrosopelagicus sp.]|nr:hypothetical protein [Candidatus Nitrosopelagicus sp.]
MKKKEIKLGKCIYCNEETDNIEMNREIREIEYVCIGCWMEMETCHPEMSISLSTEDVNEKVEEKKKSNSRRKRKSVKEVLSKHTPNISSNGDRKNAFLEINTGEDMRARAAMDALFERMSEGDRERLSSWCTTARISGVVRGDGDV